MAVGHFHFRDEDTRNFIVYEPIQVGTMQYFKIFGTSTRLPCLWWFGRKSFFTSSYDCYQPILVFNMTEFYLIVRGCRIILKPIGVTILQYRPHVLRSPNYRQRLHNSNLSETTEVDYVSFPFHLVRIQFSGLIRFSTLQGSAFSLTNSLKITRQGR